MDDKTIVELYWQRDERAIGETRDKYGRYCYAIAYGILHSAPDAEECENDTYLDAWNAMPPHKPTLLKTVLGKITRRISLDRTKRETADKRGGGEVPLTLDELHECIPDHASIDEKLLTEELARAIDAFLRILDVDTRRVFLRRYWYFDSVGAIARRYGFGQSKVKMMLHRTREGLRDYLAKEGIFV
jgi:RNA polymerase sigma-70 factor (ECF subfamily)